ncbi:P-loop containing nucleoside triphosphate hydrolase protein [Haematococcus lacustris]
MGCGSSTSAAAVSPDPDGDNAGQRNLSHVTSGQDNGPTPNVFKLLSLTGLDDAGGEAGQKNADGHSTVNGVDGDGKPASMQTFGRSTVQQQPDVISSSAAVKVAVLVRPLLDHEKQKGCVECVQLPGPGRVRLPAKPGGTGIADEKEGYNFEYDAVYKIDNSAIGNELFRQLCLPVTERLCQGFNACILAYGQTGSGKTYNMGTAASMKEALNPASKAVGVMPRLISSVFAYIAAASAKYDIELKVTYLEIYAENIQDLLKTSPQVSAASSPQKGQERLDIRETAAGEVFVEGATELVVHSPQEVAAALDLGNSARAVGAHKMNEQSSRSHAIVTFIMQQRVKACATKEVPSELRYLRSRLHLVDLAGAERQKDTGAQGKRFDEAISINKGLMELGNVIQALTEGGKRKHVPYRNSKLTRMLQDSLGGNAETLMLACVSPADTCHEQTLNTLRYAQRARAIRNSLRLNNKQSPEEELAYLRSVITQLQSENAQLKGRVAQLETKGR